MKNLNLFLKESNKIEGVLDDISLKNAHKAWEFIAKERYMTREAILQTHRILMANHLSGDDLGHFRTCEVTIGGKRALPSFLVPHLISDWYQRVNGDKNWQDVKESHIRFEKIHPFIDGNGRVGRIFMSWGLVRLGLPIKVILDKNKQMYYNMFL